MKFVPSIIGLFFLMQTAAAQQLKPVVAAEVNLLNGDNHVNGQVNLQVGLQQKTWQFSVGSGFDYYKYRTIPVYVELKKFFGLEQHQLFVFVKGGSTIAWPTETQKTLRNTNWWGVYSPSMFKNGLFAEGGVGYSLFNKKQHGFYTAAGYSFKSLRESYTEQNWNGNILVSTKRSALYQMNRILLKIGYQF